MSSKRSGDLVFHGNVTIQGGQVGTGTQVQVIGAPPSSPRRGTVRPSFVPPRNLPPARTRSSWDLFIAHAGPDKAAARELFEALEALDVRAFLDAACIPDGVSWDAPIIDALYHSAVVAVLISSATEDAFYQREEIHGAIDCARADGEWTRVIPVYLSEFPARGERSPYGLKLKQGFAVDSGGMPTAAERLLLTVNEVARLRRLAGLLEAAFLDGGALDGWLRSLAPADPLAESPALSDPGAPRKTAAREAVDQLLGLGLVTDSLFDNLAARAPTSGSPDRWAAAVEHVRGLWR